MTGFMLVVGSAFFHALWNVLLKGAKDKYKFNNYMHISSTLIFTVVMLTFYRHTLELNFYAIFYGLIASIFFAIYHLLVAKAYILSDVSQVYPITTSSPIFVALWATIFFSDKVGFVGMLGICITITGCLVMNNVSVRSFKLEAGVLAAVLSAFAYSFGAMFDKLGVMTGNPVLYTYSMNTFMTLFFFIVYFMRKDKAKSEDISFKTLAFAGTVIVASSLLYRFGLEYMQISYAVAIRQISGLFGVLMGIILFKEGYGRRRIFGTIIIITGIILLRLNL